MELINKDNFKELKKIITFRKYKKILVVAGKNSYFVSKANILIKKIMKNNEPQFFLKKKNYLKLMNLNYL